MKLAIRMTLFIFALFVFSCQDNPVNSTNNIATPKDESLKKSSSSFTSLYFGLTKYYYQTKRGSEWRVYWRLFDSGGNSDNLPETGYYYEMKTPREPEFIHMDKGHSARSGSTDWNINENITVRVTLSYNGVTYQATTILGSPEEGILPHTDIPEGDNSTWPDWKFNPHPNPLNVSISGDNVINYPESGQPDFTKTWIANVSGGDPGYTYNWTINGQSVSTGNSYSKTYTYSSENNPDNNFGLNLTVTSSTGENKASSKYITEKYPLILNGNITGTSSVYLPAKRTPSINETWTANSSGGVGSRSYTWYYNNVQVGIGSTYTRTYYFAGNVNRVDEVKLKIQDSQGNQIYVTKNINIQSSEIEPF